MRCTAPCGAGLPRGLQRAALLLLLAFAGVVAGAGNSSVLVSDAPGGSSLLAALKDGRVGSITISPACYNVRAELEQYQGRPLPIRRNVTITGAAGTDTVLDLDFVGSALELCAACVLTLERISVANERHGTGDAVDLVVGKPGSVVLLRDAQRLRLACTVATSAGDVLRQAPRSKRLPAPAEQSQPQQLGYDDVIFQGSEFRNSLHLEDTAVDVPLTAQEGWGMSGGYAVGSVNVTRLCRATVAEDCLTKRSPESCVAELIDAQHDAAATAPAATGSKPNVIGIAVGAAVGGVVLIAGAVAGFLLCRKRRRHEPSSDKDGMQPAPRQASIVSMRNGGGPGDDDFGDVLDIEALRMYDSFIEGCNFVRAPLGMRKGWEVSTTLTTPLMGPGSERNIQLGEFLGAGSFGRVYKASWTGRDAPAREFAVKVMEHNADASPAVENEVQLMLSFNHPNIVRAFYCVTYTATSPNNTGSASNTGAGSTSSNNLRDPTLVVASTSAGSSGSAGSRALFTSSGSGHNALARLRSVQGQHPQMGTPDADAAGDTAVQTPEQPRPQLLLHRRSTEPGSGSLHTSPLRGPHAHRPMQLQQLPIGEDGDAGVNPADQVPALRQPPWHPHGDLAGHVGGFAGSNMAVRGSELRPGDLLNTSLGSAGGSGDGVNRIYRWMSSSNPQHGPPPPPPGAGKRAPEKAARAETWLVTEFCDCGTLGSIVSDWNMADESEERMLRRLLLLQDAARGLKVLHSMNVVHGDLTARNVLVCSSSVAPFGLVAKVADLGLSRVIKLHKTHRTTNTVGTLSHMPPELLRYGHMSTAVDVYAFGVMMWELYTNQAAFQKLHYGQFFETVVLRNLRPLVPTGMPADYQLLMQSCWSSDPAARPNVDRLLECLRFMIQERQQHLSGDATAATRTASAPLPVLAVAKLPRTLPPETMQPRSCPPASSWVPSSSSIGCNTPSATLRPPLPLAYGASGDYSQELPREESWFV